MKISANYTVCGYDRAGYGKSWQGASQGYNITMDIMDKIMKGVGFPIDVAKNVICIGHSAGG